MSQSGRVQRAVLYTCKDYATPSGNNQVENHPRKVFEGGGLVSIMAALHAFETCPERCKLVLELDNGKEIGLTPALKAECPAPGDSNYSLGSPVAWGMLVDTWPE